MSRLTCPPTLSTVPSSTPFSFSCSLSSTRSATLLKLWLSLQGEEKKVMRQSSRRDRTERLYNITERALILESEDKIERCSTWIYGGCLSHLLPWWSWASRWAPAVRRAAGRRLLMGSWSSRTEGHTAAPVEQINTYYTMVWVNTWLRLAAGCPVIPDNGHLWSGGTPIGWYNCSRY